MSYRAIRGTFDILPEVQSFWRYVEEKAFSLCRLYGYERLDTPLFEDARLFIRSVGGATDIVEKEMYTFADKGGTTLTLKPEGTASVCRAYLEHGMKNLPQPVRLYYLSPIFRHERPQAGRYRQHHQFGFEALGEADPALDAEVIEMAWYFFISLGLKGLSLQLNSIGCRECRPAYLEALKNYYRSRVDSLCTDCQKRLEGNPLRLLDCKQPSCYRVADTAPRSTDYLCVDCASHFSALQGYLNLLEIPFVLNHRLVRGLDYYTRTVFEIQPEKGEAQSTVGGGGRYDNLIEDLGGGPTPAVGFATGIERTILNLKEQEVAVPGIPRPVVFVLYGGSKARGEAMKVAFRFRRGGIPTLQSTGSRSLKAQLRQANTLGVNTAIIIGEEEMAKGVVTLRNMSLGEQRQMFLEEAISLLKSQQ